MRPTRRAVLFFAPCLGLGLLSGCASTSSIPAQPGAFGRQAVLSSYRQPTDDGYDDEQAVAASALAFDAPVAADEPPIYLSRNDRQPGAFFGYEEGFVEYYRLTVDDQQLGLGGAGYGGRRGYGGHGGGWGWYDRYDRRAYSERVGVIRR